MSESLAIVNTSGWDTDCNAGNVGCVLGIRGGVAAIASPSLHSGQTIRARVEGGPLRLVVRAYDGAGELVTLRGPEGATEWRVPDAGGRPIAQVGIEASGHVRLDRLGWDGAPLRPDAVRLVRELDGPAVLAGAPLERRDYGEPHALALRVTGSRLVATVDGETVLDAEDGAPAGGAVALACEQGCLTCGAVRVRP